MATNGNSGHPLTWFKDQNAARHSWKCAICLEILKDPVQVRDCGHQFCALCIDDIVKADPRCPSCRIRISDAMIFEDHAARRMIKQLDVNCCNEGCTWQGCLSSLIQDHQDSCNFLVSSALSASEMDVKKLAESLMLKISTLEKKHEQDIKQLKLKHDGDVRLLRNRIEKLEAGQQSLPNRQEPLPDYTWKIANFTVKMDEAMCNNDFGYFETEPFFSSHGYKMKICANLNEGPHGYPGYMGIYIRLMESDRDGVLPWPFTKRFTLVLVDQQDDPSQRQNFEKSIRPTGEEGFKRPRQRESNGLGSSKFVLHSTLRTRQYIRHHALYIKVVVDP